MFTFGAIRQGAAVLFGLAALSVTAIGADKAVATITIPAGCRAGILATNGVAAGTVHLTYTYVGMTFPAGEFACFDLGMVISDETGNQDPGYPETLVIDQNGGENVLLTPNNLTMTAFGLGPVPGSPQRYTVAINPAVPGNPALNEDGDTIVGHLRLQSSDNRLRTVPNILVTIVLVHPAPLLTTAALRIRNKNSVSPLSKEALPNGGACSPWTTGSVFDVSATLRTAGAACSGLLVPTPPVSMNPLPKSLDFTVN